MNAVTELLEGRVFPRLTSLRVVGEDAAAALVPKFKHRDDSKDLPLGTDGDGIPLRLGEQVSRRMSGARKRLGPRENEIRLNDVSNCECKI